MPFPAKEGWKEGSDERWSSCRHLRKKRQRAPAFSPLLFFFFYWHTDRWLLLRAVPGSLVAGKPLNGCARKSQKRAIERERERYNFFWLATYRFRWVLGSIITRCDGRARLIRRESAPFGGLAHSSFQCAYRSWNENSQFRLNRIST